MVGAPGGQRLAARAAGGGAPQAPGPAAATLQADRLARALVRSGALPAADLLRALAEAGRTQAGLARILRSRTCVDDRALAAALAEAAGLAVLPADDPGPDPRLVAAVGAAQCLRSGCAPWRRTGGVTLVACTDPPAAAPQRAALEARFGPIALVVAGERQFQSGLAAAARGALCRAAETGVPEDRSCRGWDGRRAARRVGLAAAGIALAYWAAPGPAFALTLATMLTLLVASTALRLAAALAALRARPDPVPRRAAAWAGPAPGRPLPVISLLVPLYREPGIAPRLIRRLGALDWPRERLDVLLVVEADDRPTREALARCALPGWMRVIAVPESALRTKPRAMNYALNFTRGSLVGVYDAEDAPARDQLHAVAAAFATGGPRLACVQGVLDYYNPHTNWMARCFTIEYAAWFRLVLTGFARLGLVVPLGGTTVFFRREALESLGGWDAHNVTEDADLGVRLAREGWRTELIASVTREEANCRALPWIRQRSRWLKGYAMTWAVHMRAPLRLWRDLGSWRFLGLQILFVGTLVQFLFAPIFWTLWLLAVGLDLAPTVALPGWSAGAVLGVLLVCEAISMAINLAAVRAPEHRGLWPWVPTLTFYFPLATIAAWKAAWEMARRPFYWDKTVHGHDDRHHRPVATLA